MPETIDTSIRGWVSDMHFGAVHDGPGVRTTVFLQGCPLRCLWCHNPETWRPLPVIGYREEKCNHCGQCVDACGLKRAEFGDGRDVRGPDRRGDRAVAVNACPHGALRQWGEQMTAATVLEAVERDRPFYQASGGGLTVSGGEPCVQYRFAAALLASARSRGIHACLDTCGHVPVDRLLHVAGHADLVLYDVKATDDATHRRLTGVGLERILPNLDALLARGIPVRLRCPLIPGLNDDETHLRKLHRLSRRPGIVGCDVMPYHKLGSDKYRQLGIDNPLPEQREPDERDRARWAQMLDVGELN